MRLIVSSSNHPGFNLAAEAFLFSGGGEDALFFYVNDPCVVVGCNQSVYAEANIDFCAAQHVQIRRRLSGGGAVYHDHGNLNYCFATHRKPETHPLEGEFLKPVLCVLREMNIPVEMGVRKDLWLEGKKISGTASHIGRERVLHHGTLLYDADLNRLQRALLVKDPKEKHVRGAVVSVPSPVVNVREYLVRNGSDAPSAERFFEQLVQRFAFLFGQKSVAVFSSQEVKAISEIQASKYDLAGWTYKK